MRGSRRDTLRKNAGEMIAHGKNAIAKTSKGIKGSLKNGLNTTTAVVAESYSVALTWTNNGELSAWLTERLSQQGSTAASEAMDAEYLRTYIGGNWHRLYDGGHSLLGSWSAVRETLPDLSVLEAVGTWANEYWKDLITTRGMPIITFDHADSVGEYFKHLDCVNVAQLIGGGLTGVSIYCNWNDPTKLIASATSIQCSGLAYANVVAPMISLIGFGRAYFLLSQSEQSDLRDLIEPTLKGLTRSGASILLISVIPGGFFLHLSSGIVISIAHKYAWEKGKENKEVIFSALKETLQALCGALPERPRLLAIQDKSEAGA